MPVRRPRTRVRGRRRLLPALATAMLLVAAACSDGTTRTDADTTGEPGRVEALSDEAQAALDELEAVELPARPEAAWTVLVYVIGDTDLEPFAVEDVVEMSEAGLDGNANVVVLIDRTPEEDDSEVPGIGDFDDARLLVAGDGEITELAAPGELNMGSGRTLSTFVALGLEAFPAERTAVVLWDHGAGWPGMGPDDTDDADVLDLAEIETGLRQGLQRAGVDRLDLVGFDACLMATYEVASAVAPHARFLLASEELEPGFGWDWTALDGLGATPTVTPEELAERIMAGYQATAEVEDDDETITLSLVDLDRIGPLQAALGRLAAKATADLDRFAAALGTAQARSLGFGVDPDPELDAGMVDLGDFAAQLAEVSPELAPAAREVLAALDAAVVTSVAGEATTDATGLSIYFPAGPDAVAPGYAYLANVPHWPKTLTAYAEAGRALASSGHAGFASPDAGATGTFSANGVRVQGRLTPASAPNVTEAYARVGVLVDGALAFVGDRPARLTGPDTNRRVDARWDLTLAVLSDGKREALAYVGVETDPDDADLLRISIPLTYYPPGVALDSEDGVDVDLDLTLDQRTGEVESMTFYEIGDEGTYGELVTEPGGRIVPVVVEVDANGEEFWVETTDRALVADLDRLELRFDTLPEGAEIVVDLVALDYGGNSDVVTFEGVVPRR